MMIDLRAQSVPVFTFESQCPEKCHMNADDADAVDFMEIAAHLSYLGYSVMPPPDGSCWFGASHPDRWSFGFMRWRGFLWLRCAVNLPAGESEQSVGTLEWVNDLRRGARITSFCVQRDQSGSDFVEASAFLPFTYERKAFGIWMLQWIQETSRIVVPASRRGELNNSR
jgi:hypothetical protein